MSMSEIRAVFCRAGSTWNAHIAEYCAKSAIPLLLSQDDLIKYDDLYLNTIDEFCDVIVLHTSPAYERTILQWGIECKATDLHSSLIGADVQFEEELIQHYVRNPHLTRYSLVVAGAQESQDIQHLSGLCSRHGVNWTWYGSQESAVKGIFKMIQHAEDEIDCRKPIYRNKTADVPQFVSMLATFWKMTGDRALQINDQLIKEGFTGLKEMFEHTEDCLEDNSNLRRTWIDSYYCGIEPKTNLLKDPKGKKTKRAEVD